MGNKTLLPGTFFNVNSSLERLNANIFNLRDVIIPNLERVIEANIDQHQRLEQSQVRIQQTLVESEQNLVKAEKALEQLISISQGGRIDLKQCKPYCDLVNNVYHQWEKIQQVKDLFARSQVQYEQISKDILSQRSVLAENRNTLVTLLRQREYLLSSPSMRDFAGANMGNGDGLHRQAF